MKNITIISMLLAFAAVSFGQQVPASNPSAMQTEYLKKSKKQKTWAWITTGVGVVTIGLALINDINDPFVGIPGIDDAAQASYITAYVIGGACVATGIVLFVASDKNKKKANTASVFFDIKKAPMLQQTVIRNQSFPAVGVRITL